MICQIPEKVIDRGVELISANGPPGLQFELLDLDILQLSPAEVLLTGSFHP
jgi:hypothetical protein